MKSEHPSSSNFQSNDVELALMKAASIELCTELMRDSILIPGCTHPVQVDGVSRSASPPLLVEAYAHIGKLKGAQPDKLAQDILKLRLIKELCEEFKDARLVIVFPKQSTGPSGWLKVAAQTRGAVLLPVTIDPDLIQKLLSIRRKQGGWTMPTDVES